MLSEDNIVCVHVCACVYASPQYYNPKSRTNVFDTILYYNAIVNTFTLIIRIMNVNIPLLMDILCNDLDHRVIACYCELYL